MSGVLSATSRSRRERFAARAHVLFFGLCVAGSAVLILLHPEARPQAALMALLISGAGAVMVRARTPLWSLVLLTVTGVLAYAVGSPSLAMTQIVLSLAGIASALYFSVRRAVLAMLAYHVVWSVVVSWSTPEQFLEFTDRALQAFAFAVAGTAVLAVIESQLRALDEAHEKQLSVRLAGHLERERQRTLTLAKRLVHDEFIGTLRLLADGGPASDRTAQAAAQDAVMRVRQVSDPDLPRTLTDWVHHLVKSSPVEATVVEPEGRRSDPPLSDAEVEAVTAALGEALRNVARHGGGSRAVVQILAGEDRAEVRVMDRGPGVAIEIVAGWGLTHSVQEPMAGIGGTARLEDSTGGGVTVVLSWPRSARSGPRLLESQRVTAEAAERSPGHGAPAAAERKPWGLPWLMSLPALAGNAYLGVRYSWGDEHMVAELLLGLVTLLATLAAVHRLARHALSAAQLAAYALFTGLATHAGIALAEPDAVHGYDSWIVAFANIGLVVVAFYCPRPHALAALVPSLLVVIWHVAVSSDPYAGMGALLAVTGLPVVAAHFGATLRDVSREVEAEEAVIAQVLHEAARVRAQDRVEEPLLEFLRTDVLPWLDRLDWAEISAADRRHAGLLSAALRDQLYLPDVLDPALRERIWHGRAAGQQVTLQAPEGEVSNVPVLLRLLDRILDIAHLERISLRFPSDIHQDADLLVVPPLTDPDIHHVTRPLGAHFWESTTDVVSTRITIRRAPIN